METKKNKIVLVPYAVKDGIPTFRNSELARMYQQVYEEGWGPELFNDGSINSVDDFVSCMVSPGVMFWGLFCNNELMAIAWLNRIERTHAHVHYGIFKNWRKSAEVAEAQRMFFDQMLAQEYNGKTLFEVIIASTPVTCTRMFPLLDRLGFRRVGEIPNYIWSDKLQCSVTGVISCITREDLLK